MGWKYSEGQSELHLFVPKPSVRPLGMGLPRPVWALFNCPHTGVERFQSSMFKLDIAPTSIYECGTFVQNHYPHDSGIPITLCPQRIPWIAGLGC